MTVRVYRSSDAGAPALRGYTPGDLINLFNKCLVTGYGSQAPAGWTMPFSASNVAAFKQGGGNGYYLRVDDSDATANSTRSAKCVGYEAMSDVNTGSPSSFPTPAQAANGARIFTYYSGTAANARAWKLVATEKWFIFSFVNTDGVTVSQRSYNFDQFMFGDFLSNKAGDIGNCIIAGNFSGTVAYNVGGCIALSVVGTLNLAGYSNRNYDQLTGSTAIYFLSDYAKSPVAFPGTAGLPYPNPSDGGMYLAPIWIMTAGAVLRGTLPGVWVPCHNIVPSFYPGDTFSGSGSMAGKTFELFASGYSAGSNGYFMEVSNTW